MSESMKSIILTNDFHSTRIILRPRADGTLSERTRMRAKQALCVDGCTCSDDWGRRGRQPDPDRAIETICSYRSGPDYLTGHVVTMC